MRYVILQLLPKNINNFLFAAHTKIMKALTKKALPIIKLLLIIALTIVFFAVSLCGCDNRSPIVPEPEPKLQSPNDLDQKLSNRQGGNVNITPDMSNIEQNKGNRTFPYIGPNPNLNKPMEEQFDDTMPRLIEPEPYIVRQSKLWDSDIKWTANVTNGEILDVLRTMGIKVATIKPIYIDTVDAIGCAAVLSVGGKMVNAYQFCDRLGMPSSYITDIKIEQDNVIFTGMGTFTPPDDRFPPPNLND